MWSLNRDLDTEAQVSFPDWQCLVSYDALDLCVDKEGQIRWPLGPLPNLIYDSTFAFQGPKSNRFL